MAYFMTSNCPPPYLHVSAAQNVTPEQALFLIEDYLSKTTDHPHLHPDCRIKESGPTLDGRASGASIALHQLRRIVRGLKGERLMPENLKQADEKLSGETGSDAEGEEDQPLTPVASQRDLLSDGEERLAARDAKSPYSENDASAEIASPKFAAADSVEKSYNQQMLEQGERGIIEGEIGPRDTGVRNATKAPTIKQSRSDDSKQRQKKRKRESASEANKSRKAIRANLDNEQAELHEDIQVADSQQLVHTDLSRRVKALGAGHLPAGKKKKEKKERRRADQQKTRDAALAHHSQALNGARTAVNGEQEKKTKKEKKKRSKDKHVGNDGT